MNLNEFNPVQDMNAIDGIISELSSRRDRPQGYPFSKVTIYSVCPEAKHFMPEFDFVEASSLSSMKKLDFKKAGKVFGSKVQEMKNNLDKVPNEFIITASRFDVVDEKNKKTTGCRKFLVEVENEDCEDWWKAIQFRKLVKKYVTEDLGIHIVPTVFGDKYPEKNPDCVARVWVDLINCTEALYQSLQKYGKKEFECLPIRINIPSRAQLFQGIDYSGSVNLYDSELGNITLRVRT